MGWPNARGEGGEPGGGSNVSSPLRVVVSSTWARIEPLFHGAGDAGVGCRGVGRMRLRRGHFHNNSGQVHC